MRYPLWFGAVAVVACGSVQAQAEPRALTERELDRVVAGADLGDLVSRSSRVTQLGGSASVPVGTGGAGGTATMSLRALLSGYAAEPGTLTGLIEAEALAPAGGPAPSVHTFTIAPADVAADQSTIQDQGRTNGTTFARSVSRIEIVPVVPANRQPRNNAPTPDVMASSATPARSDGIAAFVRIGRDAGSASVSVSARSTQTSPLARP